MFSRHAAEILPMRCKPLFNQVSQSFKKIFQTTKVTNPAKWKIPKPHVNLFDPNKKIQLNVWLIINVYDLKSVNIITYVEKLLFYFVK